MTSILTDLDSLPSFNGTVPDVDLMFGVSTCQHFKNLKSLEAYAEFTDRWVKDTQIYKPNSNDAIIRTKISKLTLC